ncbi:hypothetical protein M0R04_13400 [Candidatus Dojkabacteria bacterium]|jgi:hypothetical protein|nr:hypothetical protein [Candidatus Dojkabacteria bacterium]
MINNTDIAPSRKRFIPKVWRKLPFTPEEVEIIDRLVKRVKGRIKYKKNSEYFCKKTVIWRKKNWEHALGLGRARRRKLKIKVLSHYGELRCPDCGETDILKLSLDHVNNDGKQHRELATKKVSGYMFYRDLENRGFPPYPPLQILCRKCNLEKGRQYRLKKIKEVIPA